MQREESYEEQIRDLTTRLKDVRIVLFSFINRKNSNE